MTSYYGLMKTVLYLSLTARSRSWTGVDHGSLFSGPDPTRCVHEIVDPIRGWTRPVVISDLQHRTRKQDTKILKI